MESGIYKFVNRYDGFVLTATDYDDRLIVIPEDGSPNQLWKVDCPISAPPGSCIIKSVGRKHHIGPLNGVAKNGVPVVLGENSGWTLAPEGKGFVRLFITGTDLNAEAFIGINPNNHPIVLHERKEEADNQIWERIRVDRE